MASYDVLIIGSGISGLVTAKELGKTGLNVMVLEAREHSGGRASTVEEEGFPFKLEVGAEFIHGELSETLSLLKEAGIGIKKVEGEVWKTENGNLIKSDSFIENIPLLKEKLKHQKEEITVKDFLQANFPGDENFKYRESIKNFVEGYDAADYNIASIKVLKEELPDDDKMPQYKAEGGYDRLVQYLEDKARKSGISFRFSSIAKEVRWQENGVDVLCEDGESYHTGKVIITVPLGVLQNSGKSKSPISFVPPLSNLKSQIMNLGFGSVIKIHLLFKEFFWQTVSERIGFIFSDAEVPTWWIQFPESTGLLTGWIGGPKADIFSEKGDKEIIRIALLSLSGIFKIPVDNLSGILQAKKITRWSEDSFAQGAYSYKTVNSSEIIKDFQKSIGGVLYFAGEAFYNGPETGTVEGAIGSGKFVADLVLKTEK